MYFIWTSACCVIKLIYPHQCLLERTRLTEGKYIIYVYLYLDKSLKYFSSVFPRACPSADRSVSKDIVRPQTLFDIQLFLFRSTGVGHWWLAAFLSFCCSFSPNRVEIISSVHLLFTEPLVIDIQ